MRPPIAHAGNGVAHGSRRYRCIRPAEVNESHFSSYEEFEWTAGLKLRAKQSGQRSDFCGYELGAHAVVKGRGEVALKVIVHLGFDLRKSAYVKSRAGAEAHEVGGVG